MKSANVVGHVWNESHKKLNMAEIGYKWLFQTTENVAWVWPCSCDARSKNMVFFAGMLIVRAFQRLALQMAVPQTIKLWA